MRMTISVPTFASILLIFSLACLGQAAIVTSSQAISESPAKASQVPEPSKVSTKPGPDANNLSPRISFEKTVCDLGDVGRGTKNTCEFKFTNTGQALLKIGKINQICLPRLPREIVKRYLTGVRNASFVFLMGRNQRLKVSNIFECFQTFSIVFHRFSYPDCLILTS